METSGMKRKLYVAATRLNTKTQTPHTVMNATETKGNWNILKGKLKQKWADLTDDDLQFAEGKGDELIGRIQKRTGESREEIKRYMDEECDECE